MIKYYKLFDLLNRRGMKKTDLLMVISSPTLAKLSKGEPIKTDVIDKICTFLECQPGDIMEWENDKVFGSVMSAKIVDQIYEMYEYYHDEISKSEFSVLLQKCTKIKRGTFEVDETKLIRLLRNELNRSIQDEELDIEDGKIKHSQEPTDSQA